ncbi:phage tail assembly protein T [Nocardiopsis alba]
MLACIDARELSEWMAYEQLTGPLGPARGDIHAGIVASMIYNTNRGKNQRAREPGDFVPKWGGRKPQSWQEQLTAIKAANAALGGTEGPRAPLHD